MTWAKSKNERFVEKWFRENGFEASIKKQFISKTIWQVSKDGVDDVFEQQKGIEDIKGYMEMYREQFKMKCELIRLRAIVK